jgi:hypothetical protein
MRRNLIARGRSGKHYFNRGWNVYIGKMARESRIIEVFRLRRLLKLGRGKFGSCLFEIVADPKSCHAQYTNHHVL